MKKIIAIFLLVVAIHTRAQTTQRYDVLITEIFPDPSPSIALPNAEFIELFNRSPNPISLQQWKLSDGSSTAIINTAFVLQPDSFLIICASSSLALFRPYGTVISVSNFPSLNNDGDQITLTDASGKLIHAIQYEEKWYQNPVKADGGWSLEMIDPNNPCSGASNWKASMDPSGGSPGKQNAVNGSNIDAAPPSLLHAYFTDSVTSLLVFDESLDSTLSSKIELYDLDASIGKPVQAIPIGPLFREVKLKWSSPITRNRIYTLRCRALTDCSGNTITIRNETKTGWAMPSDTGMIVINEILFNPPSDGSDYVEVLNKSTNIIDLKDIYIATKNGIGEVVSLQTASVQSRLIFPEDHYLLSENVAWLPQRFSITAPDRQLQTSSFPSLPDENGILLLINTAGILLDELHYEEKWHHPFISNREAVSLERIDPHAPTQLPSNWTSAASSYTYGTPGYQNSQRLAPVNNSGGNITINPKVISPDQDGIDDRARIDYHFDLSDQSATVRIYDMMGNRVRYLKPPHTIAATGYWLWDGLNDNGFRVPSGNYIVLTELIHLSGRVKKYKNVVGVN